MQDESKKSQFRVDREARDILVRNLQSLLAGTITNDEFENHLKRSDDPAVTAILRNGAWTLYDDLFEHKLTDHRWTTSHNQKEFIDRCILFLGCNLEYEWPVMNGPWEFMWLILTMATFGLAGKLRWRAIMKLSGGDQSVWPFFRPEDLAHVLRSRPPG